MSPLAPFAGGLLAMSSLLHAATFPHASVAADHEIASRAGVEILQAGGNAVDAAVATSFTLSVVRPYSCGIGGGGFMVIRLGDKHKNGPLETAINYREQCPAAYGPDSYIKETSADASMFGGRAIAIPGSVAGLLYALEKYGTMPREKVMAPAIRAAEEGYAADAHYIECCKEIWDTFDKHPDHRTRFGFLCERYLLGEKAKVGDIVKLPEQARALRLIAAQGAKGFYEGEVADAIVRAVASDGGTLTRADLSSYRVSETRPLEAVYTSPFGEYRVLTMPPPSSGGIVVAQVLDILEYRAADMMGGASGGVGKATAKNVPLAHNSPAYIHLVTEASKHAFADRSRWLGDPAFADVPMGKLLAPTYLERCAAKIDLTRTLKPEEYGLSRQAAGVPDDSGTSHFSVVDADGNAVACTETVNLVFGSRLAVPEFGFVLNDEMDDFLTRPGEVNAFGLIEDKRNLPMPGKRPLSSMTPVIALKREGAVAGAEKGSTPSTRESIALIAGASGGPRIISGTLQVALNVILFDMDAEKAVAEPRFHHQWMPDVLYLEPGLRKPDATGAAGAGKRRIVVESRPGDSASSHADANQLERALHGLGHATKERVGIGTVQLIRAVPGGWDAASDPRKGGKPAGY